MQCLWRCYAADPRSHFSATWFVHVRQPASHLAAGHNLVRSFSRVARRASVSLVRLTRTSKNSCSPDAPSSSFPAAAVAGPTDRQVADDVSGLLITDVAAAHDGHCQFVIIINAPKQQQISDFMHSTIIRLLMYGSLKTGLQLWTKAQRGSNAKDSRIETRFGLNPLMDTLKTEEQRTIIQQYSDWYTGR